MKPYEQCRATYQDLGYRCEDEQGHQGSHFFTTTVEWEACWSCGVDPYDSYGHDRGCEAVLEAIEAWVTAVEAAGFEMVWEPFTPYPSVWLTADEVVRS